MATNLKSLERRSEIIGSNWVAYVARKRYFPHVQGIKVKLFQDLTGGYWFFKQAHQRILSMVFDKL